MNEEKEDFRSGMVAIIGRPNVGKSTLLNYILKEKVAIVSSIPQTTRHRIKGIYNDERGQIVFLDTPGLHVPKDMLGKRMNWAAKETIKDADCIIHLVDTSEATGVEEELVVNALKRVKKPVILGLNKIDLKGKYVDEYIALWEKVKGKPVTEFRNFILLPLSGKTGYYIDKLLGVIFEHLPKGPALYPEDILSDVPQKLAVGDIIREKLFWMMRQEIPHSLEVVVNEIKQKKNNILYVSAEIFIERESQKSIVIGKKGEVLKKVGTLAREELEGLLGKKVFLDLYVRLERKWRENESLLTELGHDFESF